MDIDLPLPERVEYKRRIIRIALKTNHDGRWTSTYSIDGGPRFEAVFRPTYFRQKAFEEALSAAKLHINRAG